MSETAVVVTCDEAGIMCVDIHPNLNKRRLALVARAVAEVMLHKPLYVQVSNFAKRRTHLPKTMTVGQGSQTLSRLTIGTKKSMYDQTVNTVRFHNFCTEKLFKSTNIYKLREKKINGSNKTGRMKSSSQRNSCNGNPSLLI